MSVARNPVVRRRGSQTIAVKVTNLMMKKAQIVKKMPPPLPSTLKKICATGCSIGLSRISAGSPITKHKTMLNRKPARYVNSMAMEIAQGAFTSGLEISSVIWAVAS